jgi:hypothetical protein
MRMELTSVRADAGLKFYCLQQMESLVAVITCTYNTVYLSILQLSLVVI